MQKLNAAKEVLLDPKKRQIYDQHGLTDLQHSPDFSTGCELFKIVEIPALLILFVCSSRHF